MKIWRFTILQLVELCPFVSEFGKAFRVLDDANAKKGFNSFDTAKSVLSDFADKMRDKALIKANAPTKQEETAFTRADNVSGL